MGFFDYQFLDNSIRDWSIAVGVGLGVFLVLTFIKRFFSRRMQRLANRRPGLDFYDLFYRLVDQTRYTFLLVIAVSTASFFISLPFSGNRVLETIAITALLIQLGLWITAAIEFFISRRLQISMQSEPARATTMGAVRLVLKLVVWTGVLLMILENVGVRVDTLIASLGITGIAVGLAVQNILGDLFGSLSIALDQPFVIGDFIEVGEFSGTVEHIGLKSTRVRSISGEQLIFSNSDLLDSRIRNFKRMARRRVVFSLDVTYDTPHHQLQRIPAWAKEAVEQHELVTFDRAHFKEFGDFSLIFEVVYYMETSDFNLYMDTQQAINLALFQRFEEEGVHFAFPTQTVELAGGNVRRLSDGSRPVERIGE